MEVAPTWPSRKNLLLLGLVLALAAPLPPPVHAQQPRSISFGFEWIAPVPSPVPVVTQWPTIMPSTTRATPAPAAPATAAPAPATKTPAATAAPAPTTMTSVVPVPTTTTPVATKTTPVAINAGSGSRFDEATAGDTTQPTATPTATPTASPVPTPSSTSAPAPTVPHDCDAATTSLITKFYDHNDVLEGDCATANNYYRFPFDGVPSRAQLVNMSKTAACTVLMQALLQLVPKECDFKRIPLRSTAEAILQLAKNMKKKGENVELPSEQAITQAIETRRQDLLSSETAAAGGPMAAAAPSNATSSSQNATTPSSSSGSGWTISDDITSVDDDGQHILMDADLLVVGTWSDNPENASRGGAPVPVSSSIKFTGAEARELPDTEHASTKSASSSLQFAAVSVQIALALACAFVH